MLLLFIRRYVFCKNVSRAVLWLTVIFSVTYFISGCVLFQPKYTYSASQIEGIMRDTVFSVSVEEVLSAIKEALLDMEFEIEREQRDLIVTFPLRIEKEKFCKYAVKRKGGGYEPIKKEVLYDVPYIEIHCVIIPLLGGVRVKLKTLFEAFYKDILYRETSNKLNNRGYYEIEGDFIECRSTGRIERILFNRISEILNTKE